MKGLKKMKKENCSQVNLKNQEVSKMSTANIPYNNKQLLKWSCFRIEKFEDTSNPKKSFELVLTPLTELVKQDGYTQFKDKLNWLYNNYSKENYQLVWSELQDYNERRKIKFIQDNLIARADYILNKQVEEWKLHFGEIPAWIEKLTDNQRQLLLDRALTCYGLKPEEVELNTKTLYTVPKQLVKEDYTYINSYLEKSDTQYKTIIKKQGKKLIKETYEYKQCKKDSKGNVLYWYNLFTDTQETYTRWSQEELDKDHVPKKYYNIFTDVVGKFKVYSDTLKRLAEDAVIRDARWMSQFNNTEFDLREHREVEDTSDFEERMQLATEYVQAHKGEMPVKELVATAMYLYNIKSNEYNKNSMVPVTDMQGPDSPYGLNVEFRDFLEPIYAEDEGR